MSTKLSGRLMDPPAHSGGFYFLCVSLLYGFVLLFRLGARAAGYRRTGVLKEGEKGLELSEEVRLLGVTVSSTTRTIPYSSIVSLGTVRGATTGPLVFGASLLFYSALLGLYKFFSGILGAEGPLIMWGIALLAVGIVLDVALFGLHYFSKKSLGEGLNITTREIAFNLYSGAPQLEKGLLESLRARLSSGVAQ